MAKLRKIEGIYSEDCDERWSFLLYIIAAVIKLLRMLSLYEWVKAGFYHDETPPARFLEKYLLSFWFISSLLFIYLSDYISNLIVIICCIVIIVQTIQANFYHELFGPNLLYSQGKNANVAHNRLRNLMIGICNYNYITFLFGVVYWKQSHGFKKPILEYLGDFVYFSYSVAWSVGSRGIAPENIEWYVKITIVCQIITTLFLFGIIIATAVNAVRLAGERSRSSAQ